MREAVKLKKEAFKDLLVWRTLDSADSYRRAKKAAAAVVAEAKSGKWEESGEDMEKLLFGFEEVPDHEIGRRLGQMAAVMQLLRRTVVGKRELSHKAKLSVIPTLTLFMNFG